LGLQTVVLVRLKQLRARVEAIPPHLVPDSAMDSIGTNDNVSCVSRAIFGLYLYTIPDHIYTDNTLTCQDSVFQAEAVVENLQEHLSVDENLGIAGPAIQESEYPNQKGES
jgi:hypothetical protein